MKPHHMIMLIDLYAKDPEVKHAIDRIANGELLDDIMQEIGCMEENDAKK